MKDSLLKQSVKLKKFGDKFDLPINIISVLFFEIWLFLNKPDSFAFNIFAGVVWIAAACFLHISKTGFKNNLTGFVTSFLLSFALLFNSDYSVNHNESANYLWLMLSLFAVIFILVNFAVSFYFNYCFEQKFDKKQFLKMTASVLPLLFTVYIYLPSDSFINNFHDFNFRYQDFIFTLLKNLAVIWLIVSVISATFNKKTFNIALSLMLGLNLCVYAQYMFMNGKLEMLMGQKQDWNKDNIFAVITAIVWLLIIILPFVFQFKLKKVWNKLISVVPLFIGGIELFTLAFLLITADKGIYKYVINGLDYKDQFKVSGKENIITIILDDFDTDYFDDALKKYPDLENGLEDFTRYTNTCSQFPFTNWSINSMFTGDTREPTPDFYEWYPAAWHTEKADEFYKRMHDNGYKINYFINLSYFTLEDLQGKVDNFTELGEPENVNKKAIAKNMEDISKYRYMPFILKRFFELDSTHDYYNKNYNVDMVVKDSEFINKCSDMTVDNDSKYFIVEHIDGTHLPLETDSIENEAKLSIDAVNAYLEQLKKNGVYDNSTIIVTADHGAHAKETPTPIFFIKKAGQKNNSMQLSDAPVHHGDLLATYLTSAGIYDKNKDEKLFGKSIFDYNENEQRERIFYSFSNNDAKTNQFLNLYSFHKIRYTGGQKDLEKKIQNKDFEKSWVIEYLE